jgi:polyhydroxyalkanoate synthesis regulator phasin
MKVRLKIFIKPLNIILVLFLLLEQLRAAPVEMKHIKKAVDAVVKDHKITPDAARKMVDSYCKTPTIPKNKRSVKLL